MEPQQSTIFDAHTIATRLAAARTSADIFAIRRGLSREQAAEAFALLNPLEKATVTLAIRFGSDGSPARVIESVAVIVEESELGSSILEDNPTAKSSHERNRRNPPGAQGNQGRDA